MSFSKTIVVVLVMVMAGKARFWPVSPGSLRFMQQFFAFGSRSSIPWVAAELLLPVYRSDEGTYQRGDLSTHCTALGLEESCDKERLRSNFNRPYLALTVRGAEKLPPM